MSEHQQELKNESLLTRLAETWWRTRMGSPGYHWILAREALSSPRVKAALADLNWRPDASDKELYAAFISGVATDNSKAPDFDSWEIGSCFLKRGRPSRRQISAKEKLPDSAKPPLPQQQRRVLKLYSQVHGQLYVQRHLE